MKKTESHRPRILLAGPGAIGGIVAACVSRAGYDVTVLSRQEETARRISEKGLEITGVLGSFKQTVPAVASPGRLDGTFDLILLATKAYDAVPLLEKLISFMGPESVVVSLQNGIVEDALAKLAGEQRIIGCVVGWGSTMHAPGKLEITSRGEFVIGRLDGSMDEKLSLVKEILSRVLPVEISRNIRGNLYSKLIINSCITSLGALSGMYLGKMLAERKARRLFMAIMSEAMQVAAALDLEVEVYAGKIDFYKFLSWKGPLGNFRRHALIRLIGVRYRRLKSSSLQSLERGRPTEIGFLNGYILDQAKEHQLEVPVNRRVVDMILEIESGRRQISPGNLDELAASLL